MKRLASYLLASGMMVLMESASRANSSGDEVKALAQRYTQVEGQLDRSVHYLKKAASGAGETVEQAWFNGAGDLIKVAVEHTDSSGHELTEYFAGDFELAMNSMFMLTRKETTLPDGGVQVDESRKYFANDEVVRELRKSARFKAGESLDTVHAPNVTVNLTKQPKDDRGEEERAKARWEFFSKPWTVAKSLREAGPASDDPFAKVKGDSEKFRVIHRTVSPDGRYAVALGFARKKIDWDTFLEQSEEGPTYSAEDDAEVRNYVVDLARQKILGETGCNFFGTRERYNHRHCLVSWSPDSSVFVQLWNDKWTSVMGRVGKIAPGPKLGGVIDLGNAAGRAALAFLNKRANPDSLESLYMNVHRVADNGVIEMEVYQSISSGARKGDVLFSVDERL